MEWQGEATAIARRRHGEHAVILTVLARDAGLVSGVVPGGASAPAVTADRMRVAEETGRLAFDAGIVIHRLHAESGTLEERFLRWTATAGDASR